MSSETFFGLSYTMHALLNAIVFVVMLGLVMSKPNETDMSSDNDSLMYTVYGILLVLFIQNVVAAIKYKTSGIWILAPTSTIYLLIIALSMPSMYLYTL